MRLSFPFIPFHTKCAGFWPMNELGDDMQPAGALVHQRRDAAIFQMKSIPHADPDNHFSQSAARNKPPGGRCCDLIDEMGFGHVLQYHSKAHAGSGTS
jgi:hypothetical protein